jgi:phosphatidylethanolamine-binding protein (PEBP) family uncharacterized protein
MKTRIFLSSLLLAASFPVFAQATLTVDWDWKKSHECKPVSPAIKVTGIPADVRSLAVSMIDHDMRSYDHGGGSVAVSGEPSFTLPEGALQSYKGPCPPNFRSFGHDYEFIVRAIAADGKTELARGSKVKTFAASTIKE